MTPAIKNHKTNSLETPAMKSTQTAARPELRKRNSNDVLSHAPAISQKNQEPKTITHNNEKIALVLFLAGGFTIWNIFNWHIITYGIDFDKSSIKCMGHLLRYINHMSVSLIITGGFTIWNIFNWHIITYGIDFDKSSIKCIGHLLRYIDHMSVSLIINRL